MSAARGACSLAAHVKPIHGAARRLVRVPAAAHLMAASHDVLPLSFETRRIARLLGESPEATAIAFDAVARAIAAGGARLATDPFGAAQVLGAALGGPFEATCPVLDDADPERPVRVHGGTLTQAATLAIRLFGVGALGRLVEAVADGLPISPSSVARLPAFATAALLARWRETVVRDHCDGAALAAILLQGTPLADSPRALAGARAAGWVAGSIDPRQAVDAGA